MEIPGWIWAGGGGTMARMADSETNPGTAGQVDGRKQTPEEIAEERIEAARESKATELDPSRLGRIELPAEVSANWSSRKS